MQSFVQEPTYSGLLFSKESLFAYGIWFVGVLLFGIHIVWGDITKKTMGVVLLSAILLPLVFIPILNCVSDYYAKSSYNACFINGQPKDNTKYVDGECFVKYDGYIKYDAQVK